MPHQWSDDSADVARFCVGHYYSKPEKLMSAAISARHPQARHFLEYYLGLRLNLRSKSRSGKQMKGIPETKAAWAQAAPPRWFLDVRLRMYTLYLVLRHAAAPKARMPAEDALLGDLTRSQRRYLAARMPGMRAEEDSRRVRAGTIARALWSDMYFQHGVMWLDNWQRHRYGTAPLREDLSLYGSAFAWMALPKPPRVFPGNCSMPEVRGKLVDDRAPGRRIGARSLTQLPVETNYSGK